MADFIYPLTLKQANSNFIRIQANNYKYGGIGEPIGSVSLYQPGSATFANTGSYTSFDMGALGGKVAAGIGGMASAGDISSSVIDGLTQGGSEARTILGMKIIGDGLTSALSGGAVGSVSQIYQNVKGVAVNPNTAISFTNMALRTYAFEFKLIAESQFESELIRNIQTFFRDNMYPEQANEGFLLSYPATFKISFYTQDGIENPYYPKIYECFLTNFQSVFNTSSHLHHEGGAPVEVDMSLSFQETKILTKTDIDNLNGHVGGSWSLVGGKK